MEKHLNFTALDFETANDNPDSVCSIGLIRVENSVIVDSFYSLVHVPNTPSFQYEYFHGISPDMVKDAPTFDQLWPKISRFFCDNVVAHFASFDRRCLLALLNKHNLTHKPFNNYCTWRIAKRLLWQYRSLKLNKIAEIFDIKFEHHNALEDARACAEVLLRFAKDYSARDMADFNSMGYYSIVGGVGVDQKPTHAKVPKWTIDNRDSEKNDIEELKELLAKLSDDELKEFKEKFGYTWDDMCHLVNKTTTHQKKATPPASTKHLPKISETAMEEYADANPSPEAHKTFVDSFPYISSIDFKDCNVCVTGIFATYQRKAIEKFIRDRGGRCVSQPASTTNFLIVGNKINTRSGFGDFRGRPSSLPSKIAFASDHIDTITFISEDNFIAVSGITDNL